MGTYAESLLTPDERVLRRERQHPIALILDSWMAIIVWGITIVLIVARIIVPEEVFGRNVFGDDTLFGSLGMAATLITLLLGIAIVAWRWWWWRTQEFLVTNRRLVLAWGVINKSASDSSLEKINDAQLQISWLGRILVFGSLEVLTAAPIQGADMLNRLHHAKAFKKDMMTAKHALQSNGSDGEDYGRRRPEPAPAPAPAPTAAATSPNRIDVSGGADPTRADTPEEVTAVLEELARLRDAGTITSEEYEAKKAELLSRL
jgi:uncharacterized membrane protein YdbT with pleckstrin-like domain